MRKDLAPPKMPLAAPRSRASVLRSMGLLAASAALLAVGKLSSLMAPGSSAAAADEGQRGIRLVPLDAPLTEHGVYPPGIAQDGFDGAYTLATLYKSAAFASHKVALWASAPGVLKAQSYPLDEFVYILEGELVTVDADGTRHELHPGDTFVIPKGWAGTWDMKTRFKKIIVNF